METLSQPGLYRSFFKRLTLFTVFLMTFPFTFLRAQPASDTLVVTLSECIRMGQQNGPLASMARDAYSNKKHTYQSFAAGFLPQLSLRGDAPQFVRSINSITQPDGTNTYLLQRQAQSSLSLSLAQRIPWTGTDISINSGLNRLDNFETRSSFYRSTPLSFSLHQSLFSINATAWSAELEDLNYSSSHRQFIEAMEDVSINMTDKFFGFYLATMNVYNTQLNLVINDTLYQMSKGRFNVGKIAENDLLQNELALLNAKTQYENALIESERALQDLRFALGITEPRPLRVQPQEPAGLIDIRPAEALEYARRNRSDVVNFEIQKLNAARNVRQAQSSNSLSVDVYANIGLNQKADALNDAYLNLLDQQQFSLQLQIPFFGFGSGSHAVEAAEAERSRIETSVEVQQFSLEQEVLYQVKRFQQLQTQVGLSAKADTVAQRRFDVSRERYIIGKIDVPNLFLAQAEKDNAYRARIQTLWNYWSTYYRLRRLTLYDFETRRPLVQDESE